jgi:multidrug resistance protein MdtO
MSEGVADYSANLERQKQGLFKILWKELKPFPGRDLAALRIAIACTAMVLVSNTFRLPWQDLLPFLILFAAKEAKITTVLTVVLALLGITISVVAAILIFKCIGNRPEFRIPGIAVEIFIGMYLFRILSIGPVGWIMGFIISVSQSVVDLSPTPEETVHRFLWLWVAVSLSAVSAWAATFTLFPVPASRVLRREFVTGWQTVSIAARQLSDDSPVSCRRLLWPLAKEGPLRLLKELKFSLMESSGLRPKQKELTRLILAFDKVVRLTFSYSGKVLKPVAPAPILPEDKAILGRITANAEYFERQFTDGLIPSGPVLSENGAERAAQGSIGETAGDSAEPRLAEAERTLQDLAAKDLEAQQPKSAPREKKSLFVADAFSNPRHVQFALKVTLAGMIGYIFYTASDYFGIHTVYYTPLIIALGSTGATMHKGVLRIVGCIIGGALGLICSIWIIPRFETLGMYLFIVFCLHGLAAWVAFGSERTSYIGLQIAMAFDLGVLKDFGPPKEIDPIRDRFIGVILGIIIISAVSSLVWPEAADSLAREKVGACLRAIARLLRMAGSQGPERERLELEIGSRLSEANSYQEQATFEGLLNRSRASEGSGLEKTIDAVEEIYVASLPWLRERVAEGLTEGVSATAAPAIAEPLATAVEADAALIDSGDQTSSGPAASSVDHLREAEELSTQENYRTKSFADLVGAIRELQAAISKREG